MQKTVVPVARELLLAGAGGFHEVLVHSFQSNAEAHDDDLQERIQRDFAGAFDTTLAELIVEFGKPNRAGDQSDDSIPLNGVFRFAVWTDDRPALYLAAAHEDRELPFMLVMGTTEV